MDYQKVKQRNAERCFCRVSCRAWEEVITGKTSLDGRFKGPCKIAKDGCRMKFHCIDSGRSNSGVGRDMDGDEHGRMQGALWPAASDK